MMHATSSVERKRHEENLVLNHIGLVRRYAVSFSHQLPPSLQLEDLIQAGTVGLLEAARKFDADLGVSFEAYASIRVRGAIVDELRRSSWVPRSLQRKNRQINECVKAVEQRTGRDARDAEVASEMSVSLRELMRMQQDISTAKLGSLDDEEGMAMDSASLHSPEPDPSEALECHDLSDALVEAINRLPERERQVVAMYYDHELKLREIGAELGVSESRVCQIHGQALHRLRHRLDPWSRWDA